MAINNVLVVYANPKNNVEKSTLELVKRILKKYKINYKTEHRSKLSKKLFRNKDLVIAVGGDGTFLRASHFIFDKTPVLGVNSDPVYKEGFFMAAVKKDFEIKFKKNFFIFIVLIRIVPPQLLSKIFITLSFIYFCYFV